jgi:predicted transcriptional regulator
MNTKLISTRVSLSLAEKVDQIAHSQSHSRGWVLNQALSAWVEQEETRSRLTREAMADVDNKVVVDHQAVLAWADSLDTDKPLPFQANAIALDQ